MTTFTDALATPEATQTSVFEALERLVQQTIGVKLFTLITFSHASNEAVRIYTNMPDAYPVAGTKPVEDDPWTRHVLRGRRTFVANTIDEIAAVFPDHDLIASLDCQSCINVPAVVGGQVIGTLNCLHEKGYYTPERVALAEELKLAGAAAFMAAKRLEPGASA